MDHINDNQRYIQYMKRIKEINLKDFAPPPEIAHTESPFQWVQLLKNENITSRDYMVKLEDYANQGDNYNFEKFLLNIALAFEYCLLNSLKEAKHHISKVEDMFTTMKSDNSCCYIRDAMEHILLATKTNIFILANEKSEVIESLKEKCRSLKPLMEMDSIHQAAIHAIKAKFFLSCSTENELALTHMMEANKLDPNCANWKYWTGKILRKLRKDTKEHDPTEEIRYFEEAVEIDNDTKHLLFLAQAYREKANFLYKTKNSFPAEEKDNIYREIDSLNKKSCDLYMKVADSDPSSAAICRRAGNGLMSLPKHYAKYGLAKQLLHKAEKLSKNPVTYHILGSYYLKHEKDTEKAVEYFQKAADNNMVYGHHELIKIKYLNDPNYDHLEDLLKAEKSLEFSSSLKCIEGDLGWYYMTSQNDVYKGLEYFWKIIGNKIFLKNFYSYSFVVKGPLNMFVVLRDKIMEIEEEKRNELMISFLEKINSEPQLLDNEGCMSLEKAQAEALATKKWQQRQYSSTKGRQSQQMHTKTQQRPEAYQNNYVRNEFRNKSNYYQKNVESEKSWRSETLRDPWKDLESENSCRAKPLRDPQKDHESEKSWRSEPSRDPQNNSRIRAPTDRETPKQNNWRLECRKF